MKIKYEIIDLTNNPNDLREGDMVKLRKGMRIGREYGIFILLRYMRYRYYHVVLDKSNRIFKIEGGRTKYGNTATFSYPICMLDLTCVKRLIKIERLN